MPLIVIGLSHRTAPIELRERFAFAESSVPQVLAQLRQLGLAGEAVLVSTCNRVELYAATERDDRATCDALQQFLPMPGAIPKP